MPNDVDRVEEHYETQATPTGQRTSRVVTSDSSEYGDSGTAVAQKRVIFRAYQIIWYVLGIIEVLLIFRFALKLLGANQFSSFVSFIYRVSDPLAAPFFGIFRTSAVQQSVFEWSTLIGMAVYALIAWGLVWLFQLIKPASRSEVEREV
jgi:YggT family protein